MSKRFKILAALAIILSFVLLLVLWVVLRSSDSSSLFFVCASGDTVFIFLVFMLIIIRFTAGGETIFDAKQMKIFILILVTILLTLVITLSFRIGFSATFYLMFSVDVFVALLFSAVWFFQKGIVHHTVQAGTVSDPEAGEVPLSHSYLQDIAGLPRGFTFEELKLSTNNFQTPIGKGGSTSVFKGFLDDGTTIAVKRFENDQKHGLHQFLTEIASIASASHVNLVRLFGYCHVPGNGRFLAYEFIENGSLDAWIFPKSSTSEEAYLSWPLRYQVAIDVAKALAYLHHECRSRILHLDIKPENILLDEEFRAHVSDFGISRLLGKDESAVLTTLRGTRGYFAPEWFSGDRISNKSDVYSYGLVLFELLGGRRNLQMPDLDHQHSSSLRKSSYFPKVVTDKLKAGNLMEVVDERLLKNGDILETKIRNMVYVALWCIQEKADQRPNMPLVISILEGTMDIAVPPETKMFMVDLLGIDSEPATSASG